MYYGLSDPTDFKILLYSKLPPLPANGTAELEYQSSMNHYICSEDRIDFLWLLSAENSEDNENWWLLYIEDEM